MIEKKRFWLGVAMIVVGTILTFMGFWVEPVGQISGSVLGATGEFLTLGGALVGADAYVEYRIKKMIHNKEENDNQEVD